MSKRNPVKTMHIRRVKFSDDVMQDHHQYFTSHYGYQIVFDNDDGEGEHVYATYSYEQEPDDSNPFSPKPCYVNTQMIDDMCRLAFEGFRLVEERKWERVEITSNSQMR